MLAARVFEHFIAKCENYANQLAKTLPHSLVIMNLTSEGHRKCYILCTKKVYVFYLQGEKVNLYHLTHLCLASYHRDTGKQCRPRTRRLIRGSGSNMFALITGISINIVIIKTEQTPLKQEMDWSNELR